MATLWGSYLIIAIYKWRYIPCPWSIWRLQKKEKKPFVYFTSPKLRAGHEVLFVLFSPNCLTSKKLVLTYHPSSQWQIKCGPFSPARCCEPQWHTFVSGSGSCRGAACVWTVWPPYIIQEMSLLYLWQASCSHGLGSSRQGVGLCSSSPGMCTHHASLTLAKAPAPVHLTVTFITPATWESMPHPLGAGNVWM